MELVFLYVLNGVALAGMTAILFMLYRITTQIQSFDAAMGGIFQNLFEKLENTPLNPDYEPENPIQTIIASFLQQKMSESSINRDDSGQFVRAEVIPPE